jgi:uncharacterized coiled-coil protein SlyX
MNHYVKYFVDMMDVWRGPDSLQVSGLKARIKNLEASIQARKNMAADLNKQVQEHVSKIADMELHIKRLQSELCDLKGT